MGEMAEYMLNGDDCSQCGEHLGSGDGYARLCRGCRKEEMRKNDDGTQPFIMKNTPAARVALKFWLKKKKYNSYSLGNTDKRGQPLIGLSWDHNPDSDWSKYDRAGLIICKDAAAEAAAIAVLEKQPESKGEA